MIRVMVVEDEPPILRGICRLIEETDSRFEVCATAYDGLEALERLESMQIDVVFTDINMPICDGVELMQKIRAKYPSLPVVVLSGYADFNYAQSALRYGALNYLLKPIQIDSLRETLEKIYHKFVFLNEADKRNYLETLIFSRNSEINKQILSNRHQNLYMIHACAGSFPLAETFLPGEKYWHDISLELAARKLLLPDNQDAFCWSFQGKTPAENILIIDLASNNDINTFIKQLSKKLNTGSIPITLAVSGRMAGDRDVYPTATQLRTLLKKYSVFGMAGIITENRNNVPDEEYILMPDFYNLFYLAIQQKNYDQFQNCFLKLLKDLQKRSITQANLMRILDQIYLLLKRVFPTLNDDFFNVSEMITGALSWAELSQDVLSSVHEILTAQNPSETDKDTLIRNIEEFIHNNLDMPITNQMLSDRFGFVPSYISKLFKQNKGVSPSDYILQLRMEKAKEMLLSSSDMMVKDIASIVGYSDSVYFSKVFKKATGYYPTQYRKINHS